MGQLRGTVLCVDDDDTSRYALACLFRQAGFEVEEAASGGEALRLVEAMPDLVILDVSLPDIDGHEVRRRMRSRPATTAIPVMHVSGVHVTPQEKTHALEEGADAYLTRPVEPQELIARARALMPCRPGLAKSEAEDVLDWLEANGFRRQEPAYGRGRGYTVQWREDQGQAESGPRRCRRRFRNPCPACGSASPPYLGRQMTTPGRVLLALGLLLWPLLAIAPLLRVGVWRCWDCHRVLSPVPPK